jgi:hypothetical protein
MQKIRDYLARHPGATAVQIQVDLGILYAEWVEARLKLGSELALERSGMTRKYFFTGGRK